MTFPTISRYLPYMCPMVCNEKIRTENTRARKIETIASWNAGNITRASVVASHEYLIACEASYWNDHLTEVGSGPPNARDIKLASVCRFDLKWNFTRLPDRVYPTEVFPLAFLNPRFRPGAGCTRRGRGAPMRNQ